MTRKGYKKIYSSYGGAGRDVYVDDASFPLFSKIKKDHKSNYHLTTLYRAIVGLNSDAYRGSPLNNGGNIRLQPVNGAAFEYYIDNGDVLINRLYFDPSFSSESSATGVYRVGYSENKEWETSPRVRRHLDHNHTWTDGTRKSAAKAHYAAISGRFFDVNEAGKRMADHVIQAYYKAKALLPSDAEKPTNHYSLFWSPKGSHKRSESAEALASVIQQSEKAKAPINWLVHGEGVHSFKRAAAIIKSQPLASVGALLENSLNESAPTGQKVFFSNPRNFTTKELEKLCADARMEFVGANFNTRDLANLQIMRSAGVELGKKAAQYASIPAGTAILADTGLTAANKAIPRLAESVADGNHALAAAAAATVIFASTAAFKKMNGMQLAMRSVAASTFGKGNDYWYTNDKDLLEKLNA